MDGLEFCGDGLCLSVEEVVETERTLEGVEDLDAVGRDEGVDGLVDEVERVMGDDGLMYDETEAELVLRIEELDLFEE